jgi:uncharacterized protein (DUF58 family)
MAQNSPGFSHWLTPDMLAVLGRMDPLARLRKRGLAGGRHRSIQKGSSVEFAEHRQYVSGDDLRRLDWNVFGKSDRYFVRTYLEETSLRSTLFLDTSGSMTYTGEKAVRVNGQPVSKLDYAKHITAALAWLFLHNQDLCGLVTAADEIQGRLPASNQPSQLRRVLDELSRRGPGVDTGLPKVLQQLVTQLPSRGTVVLITDGFFELNSLLRALQLLRFKHQEVWFIQVLAEEELTFPFRQFHQFRDLEHQAPLIEVDPAAIRAEYLRRFEAFSREITLETSRLNVEYHRLVTSQPLVNALTALSGQHKPSNSTGLG